MPDDSDRIPAWHRGLAVSPGTRHAATWSSDAQTSVPYSRSKLPASVMCSSAGEASPRSSEEVTALSGTSSVTTSSFWALWLEMKAAPPPNAARAPTPTAPMMRLRRLRTSPPPLPSFGSPPAVRGIVRVPRCVKELSVRERTLPDRVRPAWEEPLPSPATLPIEWEPELAEPPLPPPSPATLPI